MTPAEIAEQVSLFVGADQVTELRALHVGQKGRTFAGWFDGRHLVDLARHALALTREAAGVYFVPNPINPELLARRENTTANVYRDKPALTRDSDIPERRYLLIDIDPYRHSIPVSDRTPAREYAETRLTEDMPSTARELVAARIMARGLVAPLMRSLGFANPITMSSGNGVHCVYRLPESIPGGLTGTRDPLADLLRLVASRFDSVLSAVDPNTYTAARMLKVPGTWARKGEATPSRPYRKARILEIPDGWTGPTPMADVGAHVARSGVVG